MTWGELIDRLAAAGLLTDDAIGRIDIETRPVPAKFDPRIEPRAHVSSIRVLRRNGLVYVSNAVLNG